MPTDMKGSLSRNTKREHDRQPEFKGSAMVDGVAYWLSAWVREGDDGSEVFQPVLQAEGAAPAAGLAGTRRQRPPGPSSGRAVGGYPLLMTASDLSPAEPEPRLGAKSVVEFNLFLDGEVVGQARRQIPAAIARALCRQVTQEVLRVLDQEHSLQ